MAELSYKTTVACLSQNSVVRKHILTAPLAGSEDISFENPCFADGVTISRASTGRPTAAGEVLKLALDEVRVFGYQTVISEYYCSPSLH